MSREIFPSCVLLSGGLDSAVLLERSLAPGRRVIPVYVRCGFVWEAAELHWLRRLLRALRRNTLRPLQLLEWPMRPLLGAHWSLTGRGLPGPRSPDAAVYLPGRNAVLLTAAALVAAREEAASLLLGTLRSNPFADATPRFFSTLSRALSEALGRPLRIIAPLRRLSKAQLIRGASGAPLALTFSCLRPQPGFRHCGRCNKCAERRRAFRLAGMADPTAYAS